MPDHGSAYISYVEAGASFTYIRSLTQYSPNTMKPFTRTNPFSRTKLSAGEDTSRIFERAVRIGSALILLLLLLPGLTFAQPDDARAESTTEGFYVQGMLSGGTMSFSDFDDVDAGATFSGRLGYGFTRSIGVFAGFEFGEFANNSGFTEEVHAFNSGYVLGSFDLGAQYNFRAGEQWVPYAELAYTRLITGDELSNTFSANGVTLGGGLKYHLTDTWALNGRVQVSPINVFSLDYNGQELDNQEWGGVSTRVSVGLTWFPFR